jgi:hypothetical protein
LLWSGAEGLDTDSKWRGNVGEGPQSHFNYQRDSLTADCEFDTTATPTSTMRSSSWHAR